MSVTKRAIKIIVAFALAFGLASIFMFIVASFTESHRFAHCGPSSLSATSQHCRTASQLFFFGKALFFVSVALAAIAAWLRLWHCKVLRITFVIIAVVTVGGYVTAKLSQSSVNDETRKYVISNRITGLDFGGKVVPTEDIEVTSWTTYPFVVVGCYSVPFGMHTSHHMTAYLTMPWGKYVLSRENVYPL